MALALFDLDNTLLSGDSDVLWSEFLVAQGQLDPSFKERADEMQAAYLAGTVSPDDICNFSASSVAGRSPAELLDLRQRFHREVIQTRIPADARALLQRHRDCGDRLVLTTATNRVVSEFTAQSLGVDHYLCNELECVDGRYTGRITGLLNMRSGKLQRLQAWLASEGGEKGAVARQLQQATFYSDSINDLPLLSAVGCPVAVDPDPRLASTARRKGWAVLLFDRRLDARLRG